ncbi:MAG: Lrp/AsnC family transcriptional regulator [Halobacteriaceae archaeon]
MVHAFIMVKTGPGESEPVRESALQLGNVTEAHVVAGNYDVIVESDGTDVSDVLGVASNELQSLEGVERTKTYVSLGS